MPTASNRNKWSLRPARRPAVAPDSELTAAPTPTASPLLDQTSPINPDEVLVSPKCLSIDRWNGSPATKTLANARLKGATGDLAELPFIRLGRLIRYRLSDVLAFEAKRTVSK